LRATAEFRAAVAEAEALGSRFDVDRGLQRASERVIAAVQPALRKHRKSSLEQAAEHMYSMPSVDKFCEHFAAQVEGSATAASAAALQRAEARLPPAAPPADADGGEGSPTPRPPRSSRRGAGRRSRASRAADAGTSTEDHAESSAGTSADHASELPPTSAESGDASEPTVADPPASALVHHPAADDEAAISASMAHLDVSGAPDAPDTLDPAPSAPATPAAPHVLEPADDGENELCAICMMREKTHLLVPCGHQCLCERCADIIATQSRECPLCRGSVTLALKVFK